MEPAHALKLSASDVEQLPEAQALEVLAAHVKAKQKELAEALVGSKSKGLARAAKKALYQLKSSGVAIEDPVPSAAARAPKPAAVVVEFPALMSAVLGTGERAIFFGRPRRGGGLEIFQGVLHDEFGVQQLDRADTSRSAYRKHLREIHGGQKVIEVPLARVLEELGRAWGQNLRAKNGLTQATDDNLRKLGVKLDEALIDLPRPEPTDEALLETTGTLHDEPELAQWLPPQAQIALLGEQTRALEAQKAEPEAVRQNARKLAEEFFVGPVRQLYARRLWGIAEFFEGTGRANPGKLARAEARQLFHHPTAIGGFSRRLFEKVIALSA